MGRLTYLRALKVNSLLEIGPQAAAQIGMRL